MKNKVKIIVIFLILFFNVFLYIIPSSYQKKYKVDGYSIVEKYDNKQKTYRYDIKGNDNFSVAINNNYIAKKKHIKQIKKVKLDNGYCIIPISSKVSFYPLCVVDNKQVSYHLIPELKDKIDKSYYKEVKSLDKNYASLDINYLNNKKYLIWNYTSFYYLNNKNNKTIEVLSNDYYQIDLAAKINQYLFLPDYDQGYNFNKAYVINMDNGKMDKWDLKYEISTQSRIVGVYNKSIFLVDEKNEIMYELVPHKKKMRKVSGRILKGNKFEKTNIKTIINNKLVFEPTTYYNYEINNGYLYQTIGNSTTLISNNVVKDIVYKDNETVYYLVNDVLYMYNPYYGNVKLITNFEWSFNYSNLIFIY